jgi:hypothetical protein
VDAASLAEGRDPLLQLIDEWSDPVAHAHPGWYDPLPPGLVQQAATSRHGRRVLASRLREAVPLCRLVSTEPAWRKAAWAFGDAAALSQHIEQVGWWVLQPWVARAIGRAQVGAIVACVGRERHEQALRERHTFVRAETWLAHAPRTAAEAHETIRTLGWRALSTSLVGPMAPLRDRMRLITGAALDASPLEASFEIDPDALLDQLTSETETR